MKLVTKLFIAAFTIWLAISASADIYEAVLRKSAINNGYLLPEEVNKDYDVGLALIGEELFSSELLSLNSDMSCSSCHLDKFSSADGLSNAIGVGGHGQGTDRLSSGGVIVPRNTLPLWGRGGNGFDVFFWDGKVRNENGVIISQFLDAPPSTDALEVAVHLPIIEIREMLDDDDLISKNYKLETVESGYDLYELILENFRYSDLANKLASYFDLTVSELKIDHITKAISEHIRGNFKLKPSKFSDYISSNGELSSDEIEGGLIFYGKGRCAYCHSGPYFSDLKFHNIPMPQIGFGKNGFGIDYGLFNTTHNPNDLYKFRTPPLINVSETSPYNHSGSIVNLSDVISAHFDPLRYINTQALDQTRRVEMYNRLKLSEREIILPELTEEDVKKLEIFLKTLSFK